MSVPRQAVPPAETSIADTADPPPRAELQDVTFAYREDQPIFDAFSWQVTPGDAWAVIGPSGCGKSTLLYLLTGLRQPQAGAVQVDGSAVGKPRPSSTTGLILQDYGLLPWATVWDNVRLGLQLRGAPRAQQEEQVAYWLERLDIAALRDHYPAQISGGQRQRAAIARTLVFQPNLLLMDEPFNSLDALTRERLQNVVLELIQEHGLTTVLVTHNIEEAVFLGQRVLVLDQPPTAAGTVFENGHEDSHNYRSSPEFLAQCTALRALLAGLGA
ncbi:MAG: ABC transporter ATP-binding protein [Chloroflexi bacterium]|nr:ABC transporter ATP-binding protein [Chloroflexota bacterium]